METNPIPASSTGGSASPHDIGSQGDEMGAMLQRARWYRVAFVAVVILFVAIAAVVTWRLHPIQPRHANAAHNEFSAYRAIQTLRYVLGDQRPHPVDSRGSKAIRGRIVARLHALGYPVDVQNKLSCRKFGIYTCARVRNIIAVHQGSPAGRAILLSAHYDSVAAGPGASDDGSGVAILLQIAQSLKSRPHVRNKVIFLFSEGEEVGLLGVKAFASKYLPTEDIAAAINLEARGTSGQSVMFETGKRSGWLVRMLSATSRRPLTNSLLNAVYQLMPNDTDFSVIKAAGVPGLNFAFGGHLSFYHTPHDNLRNINLGSLQQQGDNAQDLVMKLVESRLPDHSATLSTVYTDILGITIIHWTAQLSIILSIVLLVLFVVAASRLRKRYSFGLRGVLVGFGSFPATLILGGIAAYLLNIILEILHDPLTPWHTASTANRILLWCVVLLFVIWIPRLFMRRASPVSVWAGSGIAWLLTGIASALFAPGASYLFILPGSVLVLMALLVPSITGRWGDAAWSAVFALPAIVAFIIIFQSVALLKVMMGYNVSIGVIGTGVFLGLAATFLLPLLRGSGGARIHRYTAVVIGAAAFVAAVISLRAPAYTGTQPRPLNVIYVQDAKGAAHVIAGTKLSPPPPTVRRALGDHVVVQPQLPWSETAFYSKPAPAIGLPTPRLDVVSNEPTTTGRIVTVRIKSGSNTRSVLLLIPDSDGLASIAVEGHTLDYTGSASMLGDYQAFLCRGLSCDGRQISLRFTHNVNQPLLIVKTKTGLPPAALAVAHSRDAIATPRNAGDRTLIIAESQLSVGKNNRIGRVAVDTHVERHMEGFATQQVDRMREGAASRG